MARAGISGVGAAGISVGIFLVYSGVKDVPVVEGLRDLLQGRLPAGRPPVKTSFLPLTIVSGGSGGPGIEGGGGGKAAGWVRPVSGPVTDVFGSRGGKHRGIDIGAKTGTPVVAAFPGRVIWSMWSGTAGNYVRIAHSGGITTGYMHLSKRLVSIGEKVSAGQTIGQVGSTGDSDGPHLHFEVVVNGRHVNPATFVSF